MAYVTRFTLWVTGADLEAVRQALMEITDYSLEHNGDHLYLGEAWYKHSDHMQALASAFPDAVFAVRGEGQLPADIWRAFYRHGSPPIVQYARLLFDAAPAWAEGVIP